MAGRKRGYLSREARRAARAMRPDRVLARFFSGGKRQSFGGIARAATRTKPSTSIPMRPVPWGSPLPATKASAQKSRTAAAKKAAGKKTPAYEAAKKIPARNQAAAKKTAAAAKRTGKKAAPGAVQVPQRNPDGTFNGSVSFPTFGPREQAAYERALRGQLDPVQQVRQPRRKR